MSRAEDRDSEAQAAARAGACHDPLAAAQAASGCGTEWQPQPERPRDVPLVSLEAQSAGPSPQWKPEAWPYETTSDERTHKRRQILPMIRASGTIMMPTLRLCKPTALPERTSIRKSHARLVKCCNQKPLIIIIIMIIISHPSHTAHLCSCAQGAAASTQHCHSCMWLTKTAVSPDGPAQASRDCALQALIASNGHSRRQTTASTEQCRRVRRAPHCERHRNQMPTARTPTTACRSVPVRGDRRQRTGAIMRVRR